jgi:hypothetical protein
MNQILHDFSLQAGGSHYPTINPKMQEAFARLIIDKCAELANRPSSYPYDSYGDMIREYFEPTDV